MKKRSKKNKNKRFSKKELERLTLSVLKKNDSKPLNYKHLSKILKIKELGEKILLNEVLLSL